MNKLRIALKDNKETIIDLPFDPCDGDMITFTIPDRDGFFILKLHCLTYISDKGYWECRPDLVKEYEEQLNEKNSTTDVF